MKTYYFYLLLITQLILLSLFTQTESKPTPSNQFANLLDHIKNEDSLKASDFVDAITSLESKTSLKNDDKVKLRNYMGQIITEYAKAIFYGKLNKNNPELQKAFYYFKLGSTYGNSESLYYLSFYSFYHLDGRFLYLSNYETLDPSEQHIYLKNYIKDMNASSLVTNSYFSSLQGYNASTFLMGNMFWNGIGTKESCTSAALYFKKLAQMFFVEDEINEYHSPELLEKRRLDDLYFNNEESDAEVLYKHAPQELEYIKMSAELGKIPYIVNLANIYYYGLRGEKRNLQKAFDYFYRAASLGDTGAKVIVGKMLVEGIGVTKDTDTGLKHLREAALKNNPRAKNTLGKLYYLGELVHKDEALAIEYFKEAAYGNHTDGQYNYGVALFQNEKDKGAALNLINMAALQGHTLAMFHLGLIYLEGTDTYYNCELGGSLLKTACERGPWSRKLRDGYFAYKQKNNKLASLYYMEAALLGYDVASLNGALIIDKHRPFNEDDIDVQSLKKNIVRDPIWVALDRTHNYKPPRDVDELLHDDVLDILTSLKYSAEKKAKILEKLTKYSKSIENEFINHIMIEMLRLGAEANEPLSLLRLGDLYQEGAVVKQNYTQAYEYYSVIVKEAFAQSGASILSQAYYNLAYINHHGLGRAKNLSKAINLYNVSLELDKTNYYLVSFNKKLAEWEKMYYEKYLDLTEERAENEVELTVSDVLKLNIAHFEENYSKKFFFGFLILAVVVLYLFKLRLQNYVDIYLKQSNPPR